MNETLLIYLFKFFKWLINREYGYCEDRVEGCFTCEASRIQDWLDDQIKNIK